jgi:hypothetical protein
VGHTAARGAGGPVAVRHLHPSRPRARRDRERPTDEDYARYIRLALAYRDHGYDDDWVRPEGEFCVVDPTFNALWAWRRSPWPTWPTDRRRPDRTPGRGGPAHPALVDQLWSAEAGLFLARDVRTGHRLSERTVSGLIPLVLPDLPAEVVGAVHDTLLGDRSGSAGRTGCRAST